MSNCPSSAGWELPETGASTNATSCPAARSASRSDHSTPTVLIWIQTAPDRSRTARRPGPVITCSTAAPSASMVIKHVGAGGGRLRGGRDVRSLGGQRLALAG